MRSSWYFLLLLFTAIFTLPILSIFYSLLNVQVDIWAYLWDTQLPELTWNTIRLLVFVGCGTFVLGTSLAWLIVMYDFPGKSYFEGTLLFPLAIPGYVLGFVFLSQWDYFGTVPTFLRSVFGNDVWIPEARSFPGVALMLTLALYPYVYLSARSAFREQNRTFLDVSKTLGLNNRQIFWKVAIPMARPSIIAGLSLALMETLADFGTVSAFSYNTMTTAIYELWFGLSNKQASVQLAGVLLLFTLAIFFLEVKTRKEAKYYQIHGKRKPPQPIKPKGAKLLFCILYPSLVLGLAFVYPVGVLLFWVLEGISETLNAAYWEMLGNTLLLAVSAAAITLTIAVLLSYSKRLFAGPKMEWITRFATLGYALPGSVIAVGVLIPMAWFDHQLDAVWEFMTGDSIGLIFTGSAAGLLFAYSVRFLAVAFNPVDASLSKVTPSMDMAAQNLGLNKKSILRRVHLPLIESGMVMGFIIVFVDTMKEMPATLLLRPFGFETLATRIWQLTAESYWADAALPALTIVAVEMIPVLILIKMGGRKISSEK